MQILARLDSSVQKELLKSVTEDKPNIVFFISDHHAYFDHEQAGNRAPKMPHFEALAEEGVRFDRAHSVCPLCSPARASMLTGLYPSKHGIRLNTDSRLGFGREFRSGQLLYSHFLSMAGYRNAYFGKWHCGQERVALDYGIEGWSLPGYGNVYVSDAYREYAAKRGFGEPRAHIEHNMDHPDWEGHTLVMDHPSPGRYRNGAGILQGPPEAHEEFFVAHLAIEKLRELSLSSQPFSLVVSYWGPHQPYYPSQPYASMVDPASIAEYPSFEDPYKNRPLRHLLLRDVEHAQVRKWRDWSIWQDVLARCYGQILQLDAATGQVLAALDDLGLTDNTLVIFCADHGDAVASHGGLWDKGATYVQEVARVPMAVRWPAGFRGEKRSDELVSNMDVTATMLEAAGLSIPTEMHSRSLMPLCRDPGTSEWPDQMVCEHNGHKEVILQRIILWDRYKYVAALYAMDELYDLDEDPYEMNNLIGAPEHASVKHDLRRRLIDHMEATADQAGRELLYALKMGL